MKKKIKIAYLLDPSNVWIYKYLINSKLLKLKRTTNKIFKSPGKIKGYDLVFILNYTKILQTNFLKKNNLNLVAHSSALPKGKGFSPLQWQVLDNKNKIPICLLKAEKYVDSGDIYEKDIIYLRGDELYDELREKQAQATFKIIAKFISKFPKNRSIKQSGKSTFYRRRRPIDGKLDINLSLKKNFLNLRIANNDQWPAFFIYKKRKYILKIYKKKLKKNVKKN